MPTTIYDVDYSKLPAHMQGPARRYVEEHSAVGSFLRAALENRFVEAACAADDENAAALLTWARWLYNEAPGMCWGSPEKVTAWLAAGGTGASV